MSFRSLNKKISFKLWSEVNGYPHSTLSLDLLSWKLIQRSERNSLSELIGDYGSSFECLLDTRMVHQSFKESCRTYLHHSYGFLLSSISTTSLFFQSLLTIT